CPSDKAAGGNLDHGKFEIPARLVPAKLDCVADKVPRFLLRVRPPLHIARHSVVGRVLMHVAPITFIELAQDQPRCSNLYSQLSSGVSHPQDIDFLMESLAGRSLRAPSYSYPL